MFLFTAEGVFDQRADPAAYQLLKCLRAYINVMMYACLHLQTDATMEAGRKNVDIFNRLLTVCNNHRVQFLIVASDSFRCRSISGFLNPNAWTKKLGSSSNCTTSSTCSMTCYSKAFYVIPAPRFLRRSMVGFVIFTIEGPI